MIVEMTTECIIGELAYRPNGNEQTSQQRHQKKVVSVENTCHSSSTPHNRAISFGSALPYFYGALISRCHIRPLASQVEASHLTHSLIALLPSFTSSALYLASTLFYLKLLFIAYYLLSHLPRNMATPPSGDFDDRPLKFVELCNLTFRHYEDAKIKLIREIGEGANADVVAQLNMRIVSTLNRLFFGMAIDVGTVFGNLLDPIYRHLENRVLTGSTQQQQIQQQQLISEQPTQHQQVDPMLANGNDDSAELPASESILSMPDNLTENPHIWQEMADVVQNHVVQLRRSLIIDSISDTNVLPQQSPPSGIYEQASGMSKPVLPDSISSADPVPLVPSSQAFPCPAVNCDKVYKLKSTLKTHSSMYHPTLSRCTWPECTYSSSNTRATLVHIEEIHLPEMPNREYGKAAMRAEAQRFLEVTPLDAQATLQWISDQRQLARNRRANRNARRQPKRLAAAKGGPKQCKSERIFVD